MLPVVVGIDRHSNDLAIALGGVSHWGSLNILDRGALLEGFSEFRSRPLRARITSLCQ